MAAAEGAAWRPALAPALVLRYDKRRDADLLLMPERVVVLDGHAGAVLRLCDGGRTADAIVAELAERFPGAPVATDVPEFLHRVREEGWLV
jgi:pyrroloquinoline quinone biosynthesis protein D